MPSAVKGPTSSTDRQFHEALAPFVSLTLARISGVVAADQLGKCLDDIEAICAAESKEGQLQSTSSFTRFPERRLSGVRLRTMWYERKKKPAWTSSEQFVDVEHHLVIATVRKDHLALHLSDPKLKGALRAALIADADGTKSLTWLSPIPRAVMAAAYLEDGRAKTLWLSGIHRRNAAKADAKILAGQDLDYSLDPFDDQSFYWSSARSRSTALEITIGVSPRASRVWVGKARSLADFASSAAILIDAVSSAKRASAEPFRFLAVPMDTLDPATVKDAYDLSILPPDMVADEEDDADTTNADAATILSATLVADPGAGADVKVVIEVNGTSIGSLSLEVAISGDGKVRFKAKDVVPTGIDDEGFGRLKALLVRGVGVNIRYDSGHSISDRQVYKLRPSRIPFTQFEPRDFGTFKVKEEKPSNLSKIGEEASLFCWVQQTYKGWLGCDDGANEKADFIHLDDNITPPVLSLIHVKAAKSDKVSRRLSVSAYEVVTGQAVKNVQWLDKQTLAKGLSEAARASNHFWKDGVPAAKDDFVAAIEALGDNYIRKVVIVQPHVTEDARTKADAAKTGVNRLRLDQLNTLLASAWRSCNGLGAEFSVIWSK